jgi:ParB-like chromosome segregation protein Spo0J
VEFHEYANLFPMMDEDRRQGLVESIKRNGQRDPITTYKGLILDGRNRYLACQAAGVEPRFSPLVGEDPLQFVIDKNFERRDLTVGQRSAIALDLATLQRGRPSENAQNCAITQDAAAKKMRVSRTSLQSAKRVRDQGGPELLEAVKQGVITLSEAEKRIRKPKDTVKVSKVDLPALARDLSARLSKEQIEQLIQLLTEGSHEAQIS